MNISPKAQNIIWIIFLVLYFAQKYVADIKEDFQLGYLLNVGILVILTAVIPYYLTRLGMYLVTGKTRAVLALTLPITFSAMGLSVFFFVFIKPYVPDLPLLSILPRSLIPGIIMTIILVPLWIKPGSNAVTAAAGEADESIET
jgi:hypothetical protein